MRACDPFFEEARRQGLAFTFDDLRLKSGYTEVFPADVSLTTLFSQNVPLKIPVASAAMDTVTGSSMAIAMAKLGGIGVIHRSMTPEEQRNKVQKVKFYLSGLIEAPITVKASWTLNQVNTMRREKGFDRFHTFPVLDGRGKLVGVITKNDFDFCEDFSQKVSSIMSRRLVIAKPGTTIEQAYQKIRKNKKKVLPLVDANGRLVGMYLFSDLERIKSGSSDGFNVDDHGRLRVAAAIGTGDEGLHRAELLVRSNVDAIVIDTAHGDSRSVFETLKEIKRNWPGVDVVVGNISEGPSAVRLVKEGANGIKVGQGPGSICTTRIVAGIGCPQVTAVHSAVRAIEGSGVPVCADGGIKYSGDIPIAIGAGAQSVMLGKLLAGTEEAPGEVDYSIGSSPMKRYRGMGSKSAMEESSASRERYRQGEATVQKLVPEGVEAAVPFVGQVAVVMHQYLGGLRAGMGYVGAATIEELRQKADFHRITAAGVRESHPHDVVILKDAPNYQRRES